MRKGRIVGALLMCAGGDCAGECCPYWEIAHCVDRLKLDAAECIVRLYKDNKKQAIEIGQLSSLYEELRNADKNDNV